VLWPKYLSPRKPISIIAQVEGSCAAAGAKATAGNASAADEVAGLSPRWPAEFRDGARCGFLLRFDGEREKAAIPADFTSGRLSAGMYGLPASTEASTIDSVSRKRRRLDGSAGLPQP
jgi:hypothetical protein